MTTTESLSNCFEDYGFEVSSDMLAKCLELCINYSVLDPKDFVENYVAFSVNHFDGVEPTDESLEEFERKELTNHQIKAKVPSNRNRPQHRNQINEYEHYDDADMDDGGDELLEAYICNTPKTTKKRSVHTFHTPRPDIVPSATASPISGLAKDVPGKVVYTFGIGTLLKTIDWSTSKRQQLKIAQIAGRNGKSFTTEENYMFDTLQQKCNTAVDRIYEVGQEICAKLINDRPDEYTTDLYNDLANVDVSNPTTIKCIGRVCSDSDCELTDTSTLLVGADEMKLRTVRMTFKRMGSYGLIPGQTIFARGLNPRGDTFFVDEIFAERTLAYAAAPQLTENLNIVIAAGPFALGDELNYDPLNELIAYCKQHKPDAVIMMGPFLDADHKSVVDCSVKMTFEGYFDKLIQDFMETIGTETEVLIVSSSRDVISSMVYPTHPYTTRQTYKNLRFLPDPSTIKINGVTIGISSTDILSHISEAELVKNMGDKVRRAVNYLFHQASFYPLNPPSQKICLDTGLAQQFAALPTVPNILIISSSTKGFIRDLNNCLVVNPGQLTENATRGTFGRLVITPASTDQKALNSFMACQIIQL